MKVISIKPKEHYTDITISTEDFLKKLQASKWDYKYAYDLESAGLILETAKKNKFSMKNLLNGIEKGDEWCVYSHWKAKEDGEIEKDIITKIYDEPPLFFSDFFEDIDDFIDTYPEAFEKFSKEHSWIEEDKKRESFMIYNDIWGKYIDTDTAIELVTVLFFMHTQCYEKFEIDDRVIYIYYNPQFDIGC